MSVNQEKVVVGQEVFFYQRFPSVGLKSSSITKVGRKWCDLANGCRMDIASLELYHGDREKGKVFLSEEEYYREKKSKELWEALRGACIKVEGMYTPPVGFSTEKAEEVLRLLQDLLHK